MLACEAVSNFNCYVLVSQLSFASLSTLRTLDISSNRISEVADYAFKDLSNLRELDLEKNQLPNVTRCGIPSILPLNFRAGLDNNHNYLIYLIYIR